MKLTCFEAKITHALNAKFLYELHTIKSSSHTFIEEHSLPYLVGLSTNEDIWRKLGNYYIK
jgi:hypothetical protein